MPRTFTEDYRYDPLLRRAGGGTPERIDYRYHGQPFILEQEPTGVCTQCGERFFKAKVAKRMEEVVSQTHQAMRTVA